MAEADDESGAPDPRPTESAAGAAGLLSIPQGQGPWSPAHSARPVNVALVVHWAIVGMLAVVGAIVFLRGIAGRTLDLRYHSDPASHDLVMLAGGIVFGVGVLGAMLALAVMAVRWQPTVAPAETEQH